MEVILKRDYKGTDCTLGKLYFGEDFVETLELPWKDNEPRVSCIPEGIYEVERTYSPSFKRKLWLVKNVPNRSGIRIHSANYVSQLLGCIAPGLTRHDLNGDGIVDVTNSVKALGLMNDSIPDKFTLEIIWKEITL
jgi:hypothetical protein